MLFVHQPSQQLEQLLRFVPEERLWVGKTGSFRCGKGKNPTPVSDEDTDTCLNGYFIVEVSDSKQAGHFIARAANAMVSSGGDNWHPGIECDYSIAAERLLRAGLQRPESGFDTLVEITCYGFHESAETMGRIEMFPQDKECEEEIIFSWRIV